MTQNRLDRELETREKQPERRRGVGQQCCLTPFLKTVISFTGFV
jgi:hypothetical protein